MTSLIGQSKLPEPQRLAEERLPPFVRVTLRRWSKWYSGGSELFWPFTEFTIRLFVAQAFFRSGVVKAMDWDKAIYLAANEYPVTWLEPSSAAAIGLTIELGGAVLLVLGLFTRPAAFALAALTLVSQAVYVPTTTNLMIGAILFWLVLAGSAAFSLDRLLAGGVRDSALPFARPAITFGDWLTEHAAPAGMLVIRVWISIALLAHAGWFEPSIELATWLPSTAFSGMPDWLATSFAVLMLAGFAAAMVAYAVAIAICYVMIAGAHPDVPLYPYLLFAIYEARGAGMLAVDRLIARWMEANILFDRDYAEIPPHWPHVVVVGAGFGGLAAVDRLKRLPVRITLIDKRNYHLFQPLLYQIATATLNPADIATPIRSLFRSDGNVRVLKGKVEAIDPISQTISCGAGRPVPYDRLIIATGATHSYFGHDDWGAHAPGLKTISDAVAVRGAILEAFEQAEACDDPARAARLLTFVIVGGGATGVELAGAIAELAQLSVAREFRAIDPGSARVILVQSGERLLPAFPEKLSHRAAASLAALGVEIRLGSRVTEIAPCHVQIGTATRIQTETVLWAAGVKASPAAEWLGAEHDASGRVLVDAQLRVRVPGGVLPSVFAIGDTAGSTGWKGRPVPGLAPAARQAGIYVSRLVEAELLGKPMSRPFAYRHQGSLATIGRKSAVADFGWLRISGAPAWWLWGLVHVGFLTGARNRVTVIVNWAWSFFAHHAGVRLITK